MACYIYKIKTKCEVFIPRIINWLVFISLNLKEKHTRVKLREMIDHISLKHHKAWIHPYSNSSKQTSTSQSRLFSLWVTQRLCDHGALLRSKQVGLHLTRPSHQEQGTRTLTLAPHICWQHGVILLCCPQLRPLNHPHPLGSGSRQVLEHCQWRRQKFMGHFFFSFPSLPSSFLLLSFFLTLYTSSWIIYKASSTSACLTDTYISTQPKVISPNTTEYPPPENNTTHHLDTQSRNRGDTNSFLCASTHIQLITKFFRFTLETWLQHIHSPILTWTTYAQAWTIFPCLATLTPIPLPSNSSSTLSQDDSSDMKISLWSPHKQNYSVVLHQPPRSELLYAATEVFHEHPPPPPHPVAYTTASTPVAALTSPSSTPASMAVLPFPVSWLFPCLKVPCVLLLLPFYSSRLFWYPVHPLPRWTDHSLPQALVLCCTIAILVPSIQ